MSRAMAADPSQPIAFDTSVLADLACPVCQGDLRQAGEGLVCAECGRVYPVLEGIPVMIPQEESERRDAD